MISNWEPDFYTKHYATREEMSNGTGISRRALNKAIDSKKINDGVLKSLEFKFGKPKSLEEAQVPTPKIESNWEKRNAKTYGIPEPKLRGEILKLIPTFKNNKELGVAFGLSQGKTQWVLRYFFKTTTLVKIMDDNEVEYTPREVKRNRMKITSDTKSKILAVIYKHNSVDSLRGELRMGRNTMRRVLDRLFNCTNVDDINKKIEQGLL